MHGAIAFLDLQAVTLTQADAVERRIADAVVAATPVRGCPCRAQPGGPERHGGLDRQAARFHHLSTFSAAFQRRYGIRPSELLRQGRRH
jgi:hypothetical protein